MKKLIYMFTFLLVSGMYAQEKTPTDKMETTKTTTTTIDKNGEKQVVGKVKETTRKEQKIKTNQYGGETVNGYKVDTPIKVSKTIQIDKDWDPFYDMKNKIVYYNLNGEPMTFNSTDSGFSIASSQNDSHGTARKSASSHLYLTNIQGHSGVGYFDNNGNLIVEYYDDKIDMMVTEIYKVTK